MYLSVEAESEQGPSGVKYLNILYTGWPSGYWTWQLEIADIGRATLSLEQARRELELNWILNLGIHTDRYDREEQVTRGQTNHSNMSEVRIHQEPKITHWYWFNYLEYKKEL